MKRLDGARWGVMAALLVGAAAGGACGGEAVGDYDDGAGAMTGVGPGGMAGLGGGGRGGSAGIGGGRGGQGGTAMAGAAGRGGAAAGGQGAGGAASIGGNAGVGGGSLGSCSLPVVLEPGTGFYSARIERSSENAFDACPGNGPEHVMRWTPPTSGRYLLDTVGSSFDTVLYASSDLSCSPSAPDPELECDDDIRPGQVLQSSLGVQALGGAEMLVVIDSYNSTGGDFTLRIRGEEACPRVNLGAQLGAALYSTFEFAAEALVLPAATSHECRRAELGMSFVWQAPLTGGYRFDTGGSAFPIAIALRESCEGALLECDSEGSIPSGTEVTRSLTQGEQVVIEVTPLEALQQVSFGQLVLSIQPL